MIKISVILTVYNGEKYLGKCLDSILQQTLKEIEIICIDDASTDSTARMLKKCSIQDDRVKIVTNKSNCNSGLSRNKGLEYANGKYVLFLDADDIFEPNMLEKAYQRAEEAEADICIFQENQFQDKDRNFISYPYASFLMKKLGKMKWFSPKEIRRMLFNLWNGWAWDKLIRRNFVIEQNLRFQEQRTSNDAFFVHAALAMAKRIVFLNKILVHHRVNVSTSVSNSRNESWDCSFSYLSKLKAFLEEQQLFQEYEKSFKNWACDFLYWNYQTLDEVNREGMFYKMKQFLIEDLNMREFGEDNFFNGFYAYVVRVLSEQETYMPDCLPVTEHEKYIQIYQQNQKKLEKIFEYIRKKQYHMGLWGAGDRGRAFLAVYGECGLVEKIYDRNSKKIGMRLEGGYVVTSFETISDADIEFILIPNASYVGETVQYIKEKNCDAKVFDMASYLSLPLELEECIL